MNFLWDFWPDLSSFDNVVLAASIFLFYAGMEMSGVRVEEHINPASQLSKESVFGGALVTVLIFVLGTYALGVVIPARDINLIAESACEVRQLFPGIPHGVVAPIIAIALAFSACRSAFTWVAGPAFKGVFVVGQAGYLLKFFQKTNKAGVRKDILHVRVLPLHCSHCCFVVMPSVQSFYQILSQLTVLLVSYSVSANVWPQSIFAII